MDLRYEEKAPFAFTGTVKSIVFDLRPAGIDKLTSLDHHVVVHAAADGVAG